HVVVCLQAEDGIRDDLVTGVQTCALPIFDGSFWAQRRPSHAPPARAGGAMARDSATRTVLLFGGSGAHGAVDDTWIWEGANWTEQHPSVRPAARSDPVLAFDNATGRLLRCGGVVRR